MLRKVFFLASCFFLFISGCSKPIDQDLDAKIRGMLVMGEEEGIFDYETSRTMFCGGVRIAVGGLTSERARITDATKSKLNSYADKCGIKRYEE